MVQIKAEAQPIQIVGRTVTVDLVPTIDANNKVSAIIRISRQTDMPAAIRIEIPIAHIIHHREHMTRKIFASKIWLQFKWTCLGGRILKPCNWLLIYVQCSN